jgi:hypothetical protein
MIETWHFLSHVLLNISFVLVGAWEGKRECLEEGLLGDGAQ